MISNFSKIRELLTFDSEDTFYHVQVMQRKKDHPHLTGNNDNRTVKTYYIKSKEQLDLEMDEMILLANYHNARVGINLNKRSFKALAFNTLKKMTDQILNEDYKAVRRAYNSVCGSINNDKDKKWIIDIDTKDEFFLECVGSYIEECDPIIKDSSKIIVLLETKNGFHLITSPFNVEQFKKKYSTIDIQKNNPTCLYIP